MPGGLKYVEHEGVSYRAPTSNVGYYDEMLVGGEWKPARDGGAAATYGSPMTESEAREYAKDDKEEWPAEKTGLTA